MLSRSVARLFSASDPSKPPSKSSIAPEYFSFCGESRAASVDEATVPIQESGTRSSPTLHTAMPLRHVLRDPILSDNLELHPDLQAKVSESHVRDRKVQSVAGDLRNHPCGIVSVEFRLKEPGDPFSFLCHTHLGSNRAPLFSAACCVHKYAQVCAASYGPDLCCTTVLCQERTGKFRGTHVIYPSAQVSFASSFLCLAADPPDHPKVNLIRKMRTFMLK